VIEHPEGGKNCLQQQSTWHNYRTMVCGKWFRAWESTIVFVHSDCLGANTQCMWGVSSLLTAGAWVPPSMLC